VSIAKIEWPETNGYDLHLLVGTVSPRLDHRLFILDDLGKSVRANTLPPGAVSFTARFAGAPFAHGVKMVPETGEITVLPPARLSSFRVTAKAGDASTDFFVPLRVHVHAAISEAWLTPNPLTIRKRASGMRLTLLARFDDGVIGDITNWSPWSLRAPGDLTFVHRVGSNEPILTWRSRSEESGENFNAVDVGLFTGLLTGVNPDERATVVVTYPGGEARAKVDVVESWSNTATPLNHLAGPGFGALSDPHVPNVLFLPDGFTEQGTDKTDFERLAGDIVRVLKRRVHTRPFDLLLQNDRINWFSAWLPSRQAGVTVGEELDRLPQTGPTIEAKVVSGPTLTRPPLLWTLGDLIDEVGLPRPAIDTPGSPLGTEATGRLSEWRTVYGTQITAAKMSHVYNDWLALSDRVLLNERDTAFHMLASHRPRLDGHESGRVILNPRRLHVEDLDKFLDSLITDQGTFVPKLWSRDARDESLVVVLCRTHSYAGSNNPRSTKKARLLAVSLLNLKTHRLRPATGEPGFEVEPDPVPAGVHPHMWTTMAHELAHSWGLDDEYGGDKFITSIDLATVAEYANVQLREELLDGNGRLVTRDLKWRRWPRIASAGVTAAAPTPVGAGFTVRLRPGHVRPLELSKLKGRGTVRVAGFRKGDVVRLRTRPLLPIAIMSPRLRVMAVRGALDELELAWVSPLSVLFPMGFPADSIVLLPVRAQDPSPDVLGDDLDLVAASVRDRIDATHNPLNANPLAGEVSSGPVDDPNRPAPDVMLAIPTPATNWPLRTAPSPPIFSSWLIGIFENGFARNTEFVHPSGVCLMNSPQIFVEKIGGPIRSYQFCHVCRYQLIDHLDPTQHGRIDRDYDPRYPA
jgi:hypothetical protein